MKSSDSNGHARHAHLLREPRAAAAAARLKYIGGPQPGIMRRRTGRGFIYLDQRGRYIHPAVFESYLRGDLVRRLSSARAHTRLRRRGLLQQEVAVIAFLESLQKPRRAA